MNEIMNYLRAIRVSRCLMCYAYLLPLINLVVDFKLYGV